MSTTASKTTTSVSNADAKVAQIYAEIGSIDCDLTHIQEQLEHDNQRMCFLLNADTARQDFYEIRSTKQGNVRRIIINAEADIVFDSEKIVSSTNSDSDRLPEFDEIDEKFLHVIPDNHDGRDYYRRLRGNTAAPHGLPRAERHQWKHMQEEEGKLLRHTIVDNFRQLDCVERQSEIEEICIRKDADEQQQPQLQAQKEKLRQQLVFLQKQIAETELEQKREEDAANEAKRKKELDAKRLAWLDRFNPPSRLQPPSTVALKPDVAKDADDDQPEQAPSEATTADIDERDVDDEVMSVMSAMLDDNVLT